MRLALWTMMVLHLLPGAAHACRFAQDAPPAQWQEWSSALFAADVAGVDLDRQKSLDIISVRVLETYKGPDGAAAATLLVPSRMWSSCYLERPAVGARVLVALNPNGDTLLVPLTQGYREQLRRHFGERPAHSASAPAAPAPAPAPPADKPFSY